MANQGLLMKLANHLVTRILKSRFHRIMSNSVMLVTVKGRKSGKLYKTPVNYLQEGQVLYTLSNRERTWWRNLRGGAKVILRLRGEDLPATGEVVEDNAGVTAQLGAYLAKRPDYARFLGVSFNAGGELNLLEVEKAAQSRVIAIFYLAEAWHSK